MDKVKILGLWERGWSTPIIEVSLWEFMVREYGVDTLYMYPVSGIDNKSVAEIADLETILDAERTLENTIVFVDEEGEEPLTDFQHPERALYVFGKTSLSPYKLYKKASDRSVRIVTPSNLGMLWGHQAALLVLADRASKA